MVYCIQLLLGEIQYQRGHAYSHLVAVGVLSVVQPLKCFVLQENSSKQYCRLVLILVLM